jgi:hypothetical protein
MTTVTEQEQDYAYAEGFLETWLKDAPAQVKEHLKILANGIQFYREKWRVAAEDLNDTREKYQALTLQSAQHLQFMSQQKEMLDQALIENQRELHKTSD